MKAPSLARVRGYVRVRARGKNIETFINAAASKQLRVWDVKVTTPGVMEFHVLIADFFRLRPLLKQTGCRVHVKERFGIPFAMKRIRRRKFFVLGAFLFLFGLYMLSSLVWTIDVKGNERIPTEDVLSAARQQGIYPFQWTFRLRDPDMMSKGMTSQLKGVSWIGVHREGTKVSIEVVESITPDPRQLVNPRHLVAKTDAVITHIIADQGRPVVKQNMRVKKGAVLISGSLGTPDAPLTVAARGDVRGLVWHEYHIVSPLVSKQKVYTGEQKEITYFVAGDRRLKVAGYGDIPYAHFETIQDVSRMKWRELTFPIGWLKETVMEVQYVSEERSAEEAYEAGLMQARADVIAKNGPEARIQTEKILHRKADNGKVDLKVLFEVEQSIAEELPLVLQFEPRSESNSE
ncbi:sporulation protein YqfD [Paenibacillus apiarius]|uniref:Sporulation protein YqfD n=1 Tax=Paenibacillus apiarius TaxID=46240 RepID=A0ABT4DL55_9BACL|nr:sporulation protein YqfD [Paenibacillus apiarius]MCY9513536.1 sporulation protein YqfD [Paenibacillus apiarius]MCY9518087.1 sporulation protein YqfD [Paenibacillus apiarius]MCY9551512.1 sporulation protein YqfD [Paenibacillus apiarius]MCY9558666.1 sporulation protein YqfD [Paenibacillus apiarius]MCY9684020.1 sporulation protein YqfD [Paenibacillus apiarius]